MHKKSRDGFSALHTADYEDRLSVTMLFQRLGTNPANLLPSIASPHPNHTNNGSLDKEVRSIDPLINRQPLTMVFITGKD